MYDKTPWKSPGPYCFLVGFYQNLWSIAGNDVCSFIKKLWGKLRDIVEVNYIDLCLIPKVQSLKIVTHIRPIALCNTVYKVLSKAIINRLKMCINEIISPYQTCFIPKRNIHENINVAHEMVHNMNRLKGKKATL